ncbi:MAG TPA: N-formylglutamate amidohydrolase [Candidatus Peribacterales bacterium]|nr:N-formylglutamate amidohydrolase [Candidatus Peribacterales bacterium]
MRPLIVSIPHSSTRVPEELVGNVLLSQEDLLGYSDLYTDKIFAMPNVYIATYGYSRIFLDVNRAPDDISREYEKGEEGVLVHTTWDGKPIYQTEPSEEQVSELIKKYHDPFHEEIDSHMARARFLLDCHSYLPVGPALKPDAGKERPDVCLGNINYSTCSREHTVFFREFFERHGYSVAINFPYQGKYTLGRHCHRRRIPHFLVPGIQIEFNQKLYADSVTHAPSNDAIFQLNQLMQKVVDEFLAKFGMS